MERKYGSDDEMRWGWRCNASLKHFENRDRKSTLIVSHLGKADMLAGTKQNLQLVLTASHRHRHRRRFFFPPLPRKSDHKQDQQHPPSLQPLVSRQP